MVNVFLNEIRGLDKMIACFAEKLLITNKS